MKLIPLGNNVIVEPIMDQNNGIAMPDVAELEFVRSRVVSVGPGKLLDDGTYHKIPLQEGDEIVFDSRYSQPLKPKSFYGGQNYASVNYAGVLCKVEREPGEVVSYSKKEPEPTPIARASVGAVQAVAARRRPN